MDIRAILKARGVADDVAESMIGNPAYTSILEGFITDAENGKTAMLKAQEIETDLKKWNEETLIPTYTKKDQEYAKAQAKLAEKTEYLKSLKAQGYDVPDAWIDESAAPPPKKDETSSAKDYTSDIVTAAKVNMELISLSNRYRKLTGEELDPVTEYEDFDKAKRPGETLRAYIDRKYDLAGKEQAKEAEKKKKYEDGIRDEARKAAIAEYEQKHGSNGETVTPSASKFDKFRELPAEKKDSWKTSVGREASNAARQEKYRDLLAGSRVQ